MAAVVFQHVPQLLAGAVEAGSHGAGSASRDARDLFGGVALDVEQVHRDAQVGRQRAHDLPDVGVERVGGGDVGMLPREAFRAAVPGQTRQVAAAVHRDAQQPGFQVLVAFERGVVFQQAHEHVLEHVVGVAGRAGLRQRDAIHRPTRPWLRARTRRIEAVSGCRGLRRAGFFAGTASACIHLSGNNTG